MLFTFYALFFLFSCSSSHKYYGERKRPYFLSIPKHELKTQVRREAPDYDEMITRYESTNDDVCQRSATPDPQIGEPRSLAHPDDHLDVGEVMIESVSDTCNGVMIDPSYVLTGASCIYPDHKEDVYPNITFTIRGTKKDVVKVFANPLWRLTAERKTNFAILKLAQPIAPINAKVITSLMWSPYALEDIGDSYIATPDRTTCTTASTKAKNTDVIRHVGDEIIAVSCTSRGKAAPGSPMYRLVNGVPEIFGLYFGHCTSGALDRKTDGSCGSRISKQVFEDFCNVAKTENLRLANCESDLLTLLNVNFPTTVFTKKAYDAVDQRNTNQKGAVFVYHSSASSRHQDLVNDIEEIQRLKSVYDKFHIAVVDIDILPFQLKYVPFIEYRTKSGKTYIKYDDPYDFETFRNFMDVFSRVGAPPSKSTAFLSSVKWVKRANIPNPQIPEVKSSGMEGSAGAKFVTQQCDTSGYEIAGAKRCQCLPGFFGNGDKGKCQDTKAVLEAQCQYTIQEGSKQPVQKSYTQLISEVEKDGWCSKRKYVFAELKNKAESATVQGKKLTPDYCADAVEEKVECTAVQVPDGKAVFQDVSFGYNYLNNASEEFSQKREILSTKSSPSASYLSSFLDHMSPGPLTFLPNTHFIYVDKEGENNGEPFSVLFNGNRGIPEFTAYKLSNDQMKGLNMKKKLIVNRWTRGYADKRFDDSIRAGKNRIYLGRAKKVYPDAVEEGQLNPMQLHSYNEDTMKNTHTHVNAYPQYTDFSDGVWKTYERKIFNYAKTRCQKNAADSRFHLLTGVSDYELKGLGTSAFLAPATYWPLAYKGAVPMPHGSKPLTGRPIIQPKSMWTVGCCSWKQGDTTKGEAVSIWANNKPRGIPKSEVQPDLATLGKRLYPGKPCFKFFPANPECGKPSNHYTLV